MLTKDCTKQSRPITHSTGSDRRSSCAETLVASTSAAAVIAVLAHMGLATCSFCNYATGET